VLGAEILPPSQGDTGQRGLSESSFSGYSQVQRMSSVDVGGAARRGVPWMNCLSVDMYGSVPYT